MSEFVLMRMSVFREDPLYIWEVKRWQTFLLSQGFDLGVHGADGDFGSITDAATREFQRRHGLKLDGKVGALTLSRAEELGLGQTPQDAAGGGSAPRQAAAETIDGATLLPIRDTDKLSAAFKAKVVEIGKKLEVDPNFLMAVMSFESRIDPKARNPLSTATGLIQFMKATAEDLGTSTSALLRMSDIQQLDFVETYFQKRIRERGPLKTIEDVYMAVLFPALVGKPNNHVFASNSGNTASRRRYQVNRGLDINGDGIITKEEAATKVTKLYMEGKRRGGEPGAGDGQHRPTPTTTNPGLRRGSPRGREVRELQEKLVLLGLLTQAQMNTGIGIFGPRTERAIERFQHDQDLDPTGVADAETLARLAKAVEELAPEERVDPDAITALVVSEPDEGYVIYGPPHKKYTRIGVLRQLQKLAKDWQEDHPDHLVQVGNISKLNGGPLSPHRSHRQGRDVDFRPFRADGRLQGVTIHESAYDARLTAAFVDLLRKQVPGVKILFNDPALARANKTIAFPGHDNHLHVTFPG